MATDGKAAYVTDLEAAFDALASLVFAEYPPGYTLAEIAFTWGEDVTAEQVEALKRVESRER